MQTPDGNSFWSASKTSVAVHKFSHEKNISLFLEAVQLLELLIFPKKMKLTNISWSRLSQSFRCVDQQELNHCMDAARG